MRRFFLSTLMALTALTGCAHVMSEEARQAADSSITLTRLREDPDRYVGKNVILGGTIASIRNSKEETQLEILQSDLDAWGQPLESYRSQGRFLAVTSHFLDPMIYKRGRKVTVFGEVKGKRTLPLDEAEYTYPVIAIKELHLQEESEGTYYGPPAYFYDPFWYDPFWYRPWYGPYWYGPYRHWR